MPPPRNSRDSESRFHANEPNLSHSSDAQDNRDDDSDEPGGGAVRRLKSWAKENPNAAKGMVAGVLLLLAASVFAWQLGWFDGEAKKAPVRSVATSTPPPAPASAADKSKSSARKAPSESDEDDAKKEAPPPLPDDVAKWKKEDYFRARQENDPKLLEAVAYLGQKVRGSEHAAQGLTDLLKPLPPEPAPESAKPPAIPDKSAPGAPKLAPNATPPKVRPRNPAALAKLAETIIAALGDNGSDLARATLEKVLSGELTTDDDKAAVPAVLTTLVAHPCPENDDLLFRVLQSPDDLRPTDREGPWPAREMRAKALELLRSNASIGLRIKLAEVAAPRLSKLGPSDSIYQLLMAIDPLNCGAQMVFYEKATLTKETRGKLEQQLAGYGSDALARLLGLPDQGRRGVVQRVVVPGQRQPTEVDLAPQVAGLFWSEKSQSPLESRLGELRSFDKQPNLVALAATIPQDSVRAALANLLRENWDDGPKSLETAGLADRLVTDPGLLVLVKSLPRKEAKSARGGAPARAAKAGRPAPAAGKTTGAAQKKAQAEQEWMALSAKMVAAWCKRFNAAATAAEEGALESTASTAEVGPKMPADFALGPNATVVAAHHLLWPDDAPAALSDVKPSLLEIHYLRAEETGKPKKVISYYVRQAQVRVNDVRTNDKADWLDGLRADTQTGRRRSIDVLITRTGNGGASNAESEDEEADLIVEVLAIEIKDPISRK